MLQLRSHPEPAGLRRPDLPAMRRFLDSPRLRSSDGRVLSWLGGAEPGYAYDEATALLARHRRWSGRRGGLEGAAAKNEATLGEVLRRRLEVGWLARGGVDFVFDTGLALPWAPDPEALAAQLGRSLRQGIASRPEEPGRWSHVVGPHHLKVLPELLAAGEPVDDLVDAIVARSWTGSRFRIEPHGGATYVHAHCYALEGLVVLGARPDVVEAGLAWLRELQGTDGGLPAWVGRPDPRRPSDAVAQAVRLWSAVDPVAFAGPIARGLGWLAAAQETDGGIRYASTHPERNTWTTIFACQAAQWAVLPPGPGERLDLV